MAVESLNFGATRGGPGRTATTDRFAISNAILKEMYRDGVRDLLNNSTVALKYMNRSEKVGIEGQYYVVPIRIGRNEGHGHIGENGRLPDPGKQSFDRATYQSKWFYGRIKLTGPSMSASRSSRGSFIEAADAEISGLAQDMVRTMNRIVYGDGSGRLCRISPATTGSVTTATVDYPGGFANQGPGTQYLRSGMRVVIGAPSSGAFGGLGSIRYIKVTSTTANTIEFYDNPGLTGAAASTAVGSGTNRYLFMASSTDSALTETTDFSYMNEPEGLASIVDDGNPWGWESFGGSESAHWLGRINRDAVPAWRSTVLDNDGVPIAFYPGMFNLLRDEMEVNGSNAPGLYLTSHGVRRAYFDSMSSGRTFMNTMKFDGGYDTLEHSGVPIVPDRDCTKGRIYALDLEAFLALYEEDYHWMDFDGNMFARMADRDAYQATLCRTHAFATDAPNKLAVIKDIQEN